MERYKLILTPLEVGYLSDALSAYAGPLPGTRTTPYPDLLKKVGSAFLEVNNEKHDGNETTFIMVTLDELWIIREFAKTSVMVGNEKVGMSLAVKSYSGIMEFDREPELAELEDISPVKDVEDPPYKEQQEAAEAKQREEEEAREEKEEGKKKKKKEDFYGY